MKTLRLIYDNYARKIVEKLNENFIVPCENKINLVQLYKTIVINTLRFFNTNYKRADFVNVLYEVIDDTINKLSFEPVEVLELLKNKTNRELYENYISSCWDDKTFFMFQTSMVSYIKYLFKSFSEQIIIAILQLRIIQKQEILQEKNIYKNIDNEEKIVKILSTNEEHYLQQLRDFFNKYFIETKVGLCFFDYELNSLVKDDKKKKITFLDLDNFLDTLKIDLVYQEEKEE